VTSKLLELIRATMLDLINTLEQARLAVERLAEELDPERPVTDACICPRFTDTGGFRIANLTCPVHGVNGTHPGDDYWEDEAPTTRVINGREFDLHTVQGWKALKEMIDEVPPTPVTDEEIAALPILDLADFPITSVTGENETPLLDGACIHVRDDVTTMFEEIIEGEHNEWDHSTPGQVLP